MQLLKYLIIKKIKNLIKIILKYFGYKVSKIKKESFINLYDPFEIQSRLIDDRNKELVIFDVGAHIGEVALKYKSIFPNSLIYCFEPFIESFEKLKINCLENSEFKIYNLGLGDCSGYSSFFSNVYSPTNSLLKPNSEANKVWGDNLLDVKSNVEVELITLDEFVEINKIESIDILKLDVQGAEYKVLNGANKCFKNGLVKMIYSEIILSNTYEDQLRFHESLKLFKEMGFELFGLYNLSFSKDGKLRQVDALFKFENINI